MALPSARSSARLLIKRCRQAESGTQQEEPPLKAKKMESLSGCAGLSPGAIRSRRFREKLKADPERNEVFKEQQKERFRKIRQNWTEEQKAEKYKANIKRVQKCREKKKEQGLPLNKKKTKPATRAAILEAREKERKRKSEYRNRLSAHEKAWINRKRRQKSAEEKKSVEMAKTAQVAIENTPEEGYRSCNAKQKAVKKAFSALPTDPAKFAAVVSDITDVRSPRKSRALIDKGILPSSSRKRLNFAQDVAGALKAKLKETKMARSKTATAQRQMLCRVIGKYTQYRGLASQMTHHCGTTKKFVKKCAVDDIIMRKKRSDAVSEDDVHHIQNFFQRGDISRDDPSKSSVSARTAEPSRFMEKTLKEAYEQFSSENQDRRKISFSAFSKLRPARTKTIKHNPMNFCGCEYCYNVRLEVEAVNSFLLRNGHGDLTLGTKFSTLDLTLCPKENGLHKPSCVQRECPHCGVQGLRQKLQAVLDSKADTIVSWKIWKLCQEEFLQRDGTVKTVSRKKLVDREGPFDELISELEENLKPFSMHIFNSNWQHQQYAKLRDDLPARWLLLVMDFGENYTCIYQDEVQSAHWARSQVTIHPVVAFYHCPDGDGTVRESFMIISNDLKHDSNAVHFFSQKVTEQLLGRGMAFERIVHFSDGCAAQYKGRTNFADLSFAEVDCGIQTEKHFFGSRHGKGPCDAEIGVLKRCAGLAVQRRAAVIASPQDLFNYGKRVDQTCEHRTTTPLSQ